MIVISSSLVLAGEDEEHPNAPVVGWQNLVTPGNIAATFTDPTTAVADLANPSTYLRWLSTSTAQQFLTVTGLPSPDEVDYLAVAGHNFGTAKTPLLVQGDDGGGYDDLAGEVVLGDDAPVLFRFPPAPLQSIRLRLNSGGLAPPSAAVVYVGKLLVLPRRLYVGHAPLPFARRANLVTGRSESGQFLGRVVLSEATETHVDLPHLLPAFYRSEVEPWLKRALTDPFFFAWRPAGYPFEVGYCWLSADAKMSNQLANGMVQVSLDLQGIVK
jgi:hypothetical protein